MSLAPDVRQENAVEDRPFIDALEAGRKGQRLRMNAGAGNDFTFPIDAVPEQAVFVDQRSEGGSDFLRPLFQGDRLSWSFCLPVKQGEFVQRDQQPKIIDRGCAVLEEVVPVEEEPIALVVGDQSCARVGIAAEIGERVLDGRVMGGERFRRAGLPIVIPNRQDPDQRKVGQDTAMRHGWCMAIGHAIRSGLGGNLGDAPAEEPRIAGKMERVPGLDAGVTPPLGLFAPGGVDIGVEAAALLSPRAGFPNAFEIGIGGLKVPFSFQRITDPVESKLQFKIRFDIANRHAEITKAVVVEKGMSELPWTADEAVAKGHAAMRGDE